MSASQILFRIRAAILNEVPELDAEQLTSETSLTRELRLDSLRLTSIFARVNDIIPVDLTPWIVKVASGGPDTLGGLASYVHNAQAQLQEAA